MSPEASFPGGFEAPAFVVPDLPSDLPSYRVTGGWDAPLPALGFAALLEPVDGSVFPRSPVLFCERRLVGRRNVARASIVGYLRRHRRPAFAARADPERARGNPGKGAGSLPALVAVLLSTSAAKLSFDGDGSGRDGFGGRV